MSKLKTSGVSEERFVGELKVLERLSEYEFGVELWTIREGQNRNGWDYRNLDKCYLSFLGTPILCAFINNQKVGDGHNMKERRDPVTGAMYYSFTDGTAERIVGTLSDDPKDFTLEERDGHTWLVARGRLFAFYAKELVDKIVRTGRMEVSAETQVLESYKDGEIEVFTDWVGIGVTILGDDVAPAIPGARIAALAAVQEEFKTLKLRAAQLNAPGRKPHNNSKRSEANMNKHAIEALAPKFNGFHIVGLSADRQRVALVNGAGVPFTYMFNESDNGEVIESRIMPANLALSFAFDGEDMNVLGDMDRILEIVTNGVADQSATIKNLNESLEKANATIKKMEEAEHNRRLSAVKSIVTKTLEEIQENADEDDEGLDEESKEIQDNAERYCSMEDAEGNFIGDVQAKRDLMSAYGEKQAAKAKKAKAANNQSWAWDKLGKPANDDGGIGGLLGRMGIQE